MKNLIKGLLPRPIMRIVRRWRSNQTQQQYADLSLEATFEQIYESKAWGGSESGTLNSGEGSTGRYVEEYCALLKELLKRYQLESIADLGCGNFNTGKKIAALVPHYIGVDLAQSAVESNNRFHRADSIEFVRADLTKDPLPPAGAAIVRQVLQHLTNAEISAALHNIRGTYRIAIITEHLYVGRGSQPNLDMPHGPGTRVPNKSGVWLNLPPFGVKATPAGDIEYAPNEVLRTWVVEGSAPNRRY
jgi:SAM-dependent methyltransferase